MIPLPERTTWTRDGSIDLVLLDRFLAGQPTTLTPAERRVATHLLAEAGHGPSAIADRLHQNAAATKRELARPAPVDRHGRPFHPTT